MFFAPSFFLFPADPASALTTDETFSEADAKAVRAF
jgi:hypothetical protein